MAKEIERRWLLTREQTQFLLGEAAEIDSEKFGSSAEKTPVEFSEVIDILQGYYTGNDPLRVRSSIPLRREEIPRKPPQPNWTLCVKSGSGIQRTEHEISGHPASCGFLLTHAPLRISKRRFIRDGWELDVFRGDLAGITILEREVQTLEEAHATILPAWLPDPEQAVEVTGTLTNYALARVGLTAIRDVAVESLNTRSTAVTSRPKRIPRIVLTGGSCAGKSTVIQRLQREKRVQVVPEVATIMLAEVGILPDETDPERFQRALYRTQLALEEAADEEASKRGLAAVVLDRGTMDGAAYLQGGLSRLIAAVGTSAHAERFRYDYVLQLPVPPQTIYRAVQADNPARYHGWDEAVEHQQLLRQSWSTLVGVSHVFFRNRRETWNDFENDVVEHVYTVAAQLNE